MRMGALSEERTTSRYNDRDDPIDEISEHHSRSAGMDADGVVQATEEAPRTHHTRFDYQYDDDGNWTERIVWGRVDESSDFQRSNVMRRTITYYRAEALPERS
jgi:succinate dehydrogenase/fumarate reductase flavoprotein subunit